MSPMSTLPLTVEWSLLGLLRQRPMYGYEIYQQLSTAEGLGLVWRLKQSQLYALLAKLERRGYVTHTRVPQESRPPRKVFRLTEAGQDALRAWTEAPVEHGRELRLEFLAKLYFARFAGADAARQLLERQREACRSWRATWQRQAAGLREQQPYAWLVYEFRLGQVQAMLEWLDVCEQTLRPVAREDTD